MNKILVEVFIPSIRETFEVYIPVDSRVSEFLTLIEHAAQELTGGAFLPDRQVVLCERNSGMVYNINMTVEQVGLKNGSQLLIM